MHYGRRSAALKLERSSWIEHWRELAQYVLPRSPRFLITDKNKGWKANNKIMDNTATLALRTLASGMMSGITNPSRPWFQLRTADPDLNKVASVKIWLDDTRKRISEAMLKSNIYTVLPRIYGDMGLYGTGAFAVLEDDDAVFRCYHMPIGSYMLGTDHRGVVTTFYRDYQMTAHQMAGQFKKDKLSTQVQSALSSDGADSWIDVTHAVEVNQNFKPDAIQAKFKKFRSVYYEPRSNRGPQDFLSESGFDEFPIIAPRWEVYGEDIYGSSPGMDSLADIKGLQLGQRRKTQVIDKFTEPPMNAPSSMMHTAKSLFSGDVNYVDASQGQQTFTPTYQINNPHLQDLGMDLEETRRRINSAFYRDLFLMISQDDRGQKTATEINARQEEKMLALAPTYLRLNDELLDPCVNRVFNIMLRQGLLMPPPEELAGQDISIEYISNMAQSMKAIGISGIERVMTFGGNLAQAFPQVLDKLNPDAAIDNYADMSGTPPELINDDEKVAAIRAQRAEDQKAQQMMANANAGADTMQKLSNSSLSDNNALSQLMSRMQQAQPAAAPTQGAV